MGGLHLFYLDEIGQRCDFDPKAEEYLADKLKNSSDENEIIIAFKYLYLVLMAETRIDRSPLLDSTKLILSNFCKQRKNQKKIREMDKLKDEIFQIHFA